MYVYRASDVSQKSCFTAIAVLGALPLGIARTVRYFSRRHAIRCALPALPKSPSMLVMIWENHRILASEKHPVARELSRLRQQTTVLPQAWLPSRSARFHLTGTWLAGDDSTAAAFRRNLFDVLGVLPIIGRTFVPRKISP